jgi:hypothetical protein
MKCLTVMQPWAWAIIHGPKGIENRIWGHPYRGPLLIHAGKNRARLEAEDPLTWPGKYGIALPPMDHFAFGGIIGMVDLVDVVKREQLPKAFANDPFVEGPWCWIMNNPRFFPDVIPYKGSLNLFEVPHDDIAKQLRELQAVHALT